MSSLTRLVATACASIAIGVLASGGCGAKTGLLVPEREPDAEPTIPLVCGNFPVSTQPAQLDVFIALDTSGSMQDLTDAGLTKLEAVRQALEAFLQAPASSGIAVTLYFFPIVNPDVVGLCETDLFCGQPGACKPLFVCFPSTDLFCGDASNCPAGESCERLGVCQGSIFQDCIDGLKPCQSGADCRPAGLCDNQVSCEPEDYHPLFAPLTLPAGAPSILATLASKQGEGGTPTAPALRGGIQAAAARVEDLPEHKAIVLLATDGFPSNCDPAIQLGGDPSAGIPLVVAAADEGRALGIPTFVIGVFAPAEEDVAEQNLNAIAEAGGSESAYVITTDQPVTAQFVEALNDIRESATACDYVLPRPDGAILDALRIQVRLLTANGEVLLPRKSSLAECDASGGFVFDKDPFGPQPPVRIQLCPASCEIVRADPNITVEVVVDCDSDASL